MGNIFAYGSVIILFMVIWFMPKRLTKKEIYHIWSIMSALTLITDLTFGAALDLYDFQDKAITISDIFLQITLPTQFGIIFLNFMPNARKPFILYLIGVTIISLFYEWLTVFIGYLSYKGWTLWYSAPFYFFGMIYLRWHLFFMRKE